MVVKRLSTRKSKPQPLPLDLPFELRLDLEVFCSYHFSAPKTEVIRRALQLFLDDQQRNDAEFAKLLKEDRQARLTSVVEANKFSPDMEQS
jgi:hypothetical protein